MSYDLNLRLIAKKAQSLYGPRAFMPMANMTLMQISAMIKRKANELGLDINLDVFDERMLANGQQLPTDDQTDAVLSTFMTGTHDHAYEMADQYRKRGVPVISGGIHTTLNPQEAAQHADAIVIGEGESIFEDLILDIKNGSPKERYQASSFCDLKDLPMPDYDLFNPRDYFNSFPIFFTRGCPYNCSYCCVREAYGSKLRKRPVADIDKQVAYIVERFGSQCQNPRLNLSFIDDNILGIPKYAMEVFKVMQNHNIPWNSPGSLTADEKMIAAAAKSGCELFWIGFESLNRDNLLYLNKPHNDIAQYSERIKMMHDYGIGVYGFIMMGLPYDTPDTFDRIIEFAEKNQVEGMIIILLTPTPGTALFDRKDWPRAKKHREFNDVSNGLPIWLPKGMSQKSFRQMFVDKQRQFHAPQSLQRRIPDYDGMVDGTVEPTLAFFVNGGYGEEWRKKDIKDGYLWDRWAKGKDCGEKFEAVNKTQLNDFTWQQNSRGMSDSIIEQIPGPMRSFVEGKMSEALLKVTKGKLVVTESVMFEATAKHSPFFIRGQAVNSIKKLVTQPSV